jgi:hypothetical protein
MFMTRDIARYDNGIYRIAGGGYLVTFSILAGALDALGII